MVTKIPKVGVEDTLQIPGAVDGVCVRFRYLPAQTVRGWSLRLLAIQHAESRRSAKEGLPEGMETPEGFEDLIRLLDTVVVDSVVGIGGLEGVDPKDAELAVDMIQRMPLPNQISLGHRLMEVQRLADPFRATT